MWRYRGSGQPSSASRSMPTCESCGTFWCRASMSGPAEDCDCGKNQNLRQWREEHPREPDEDELERRRMERTHRG